MNNKTGTNPGGNIDTHNTRLFYTEQDKQVLLEELLKIEGLEFIYQDLKCKKNLLDEENQSLVDNLPTLIERNTQIAINKGKNQEFLNLYTSELGEMKLEQDNIIRAARKAFIAKARELSKDEEYKEFAIKNNLTHEALVEYILQDMIAKKLQEVSVIS